MKFKIVESYTDYGYEEDGIELASDNSDEVSDEEEKTYVVPYITEYKKYLVTIQNKPNQEVLAKNKEQAAMICRRKFRKDKIKILGIKEI